MASNRGKTLQHLAQQTPLKHVTTAFERHRRSAFVVGFISGLVLSLGSLTTVMYLAERRDKRRRKKRLRKYGLDSSMDAAKMGEGSSFESEAQMRRIRKGTIEVRSGEVVRGIEGLIGNTPLMRINSLSDATGCEILGKAEFLNPAGSPKDRVALQILNDAEEEGLLHPHTGSCIFEGTVGSTGISLATLARAKGYRCHIVIPDDVATEKVELLRKLGAEIEAVRPRVIADPKHFVNEARKQAKAFGMAELIGPHPSRDSKGFFPTSVVASGHDSVGGIPAAADKEDDGEVRLGSSVVASSAVRSNVVVTTKADFTSTHEDAKKNDDPDALKRSARGFFADQFENSSNFWAHFNNTGPEIWQQTGGMLDAFVAGAGTGGTLSGVAAYLKRACALEHHTDQADVHVVLADPQGSGLYNRVKYGVMFNATEKEGTRRRHQVDTVVEGIGINRLTHNLELGLRCIDDAERVTDDEAARMGRHLVLNDGLFLGSSSAVNCVAAVRTALKLKKRKHRGGWLLSDAPVVVTILCDSGSRHLSKFHDDEALKRLGVPGAGSSDISDILDPNNVRDDEDEDGWQEA